MPCRLHRHLTALEINRGLTLITDPAPSKGLRSAGEQQTKWQPPTRVGRIELRSGYPDTDLPAAVPQLSSGPPNHPLRLAVHRLRLKVPKVTRSSSSSISGCLRHVRSSACQRYCDPSNSRHGQASFLGRLARGAGTSEGRDGVRDPAVAGPGDLVEPPDGRSEVSLRARCAS
jgi:hypothetical protein